MEEIIFFHDSLMYILFFVSILVGFILGYGWLGGFRARVVNARKVLEVFWTTFPALILVLVAVPSLKLLYFSDGSFNYPTSDIKAVKVIGHQWYWEYTLDLRRDYWVSFNSYLVPLDVLEFGGFRLLEADNPLLLVSGDFYRFIVGSSDVLHSFALPSLGVKLDAVPGRLNQQVVYINYNGVYFGQCSEICGANHSFMPITLEVL